MRLELWQNCGTSYLKKTEVEVLSVVDLSAESFFFVGDATQVDLIFFSEEIICVLSPRVNNASV